MKERQITSRKVQLHPSACTRVFCGVLGRGIDICGSGSCASEDVFHVFEKKKEKTLWQCEFRRLEKNIATSFWRKEACTERANRKRKEEHLLSHVPQF